MRLISLAIMFVIIISPFLCISGIQSRIIQKDREIRAFYDQVVDNAVQDAVYVLSRLRNQVSGDAGFSLQNMREIAAAHFFDSLFFSFGVYGDEAGMMRVKGCIPVIVFLERDGYVACSLDQYRGAEGYEVIDYCWYPKKPYSDMDETGRYLITYTLGDDVAIYDILENHEMEGLFSEFSDIIPSFQTREMFETARLSAISRSVEKDLADQIARFNSISSRMGVTHLFRFPRIEGADWIRALTDEGILVFAQGFPVLTGSYYESTAFGGARILEKTGIVGYEREGKLIYCRETCEFYLDIKESPDFNEETLVHFADAREAASNGYYPCSYCKP